MCISPLRIKNGHHLNGLIVEKFVDVPCGRCIECLKDRQDEWFTRFYCERRHQLKLNPKSFTVFFTLTYSDENLPFDRETSVHDIQLFRKKLNYYGKINRYYFIQEFGSTYNRVHFHGLLFGVEGSLNSVRKLLDSCWGKGRTNGQIVRGDGAYRYVAKYVTKVSNYDDDFVLPWRPYVNCSQRPGLGREFISAGVCDYLRANPSNSLRSSVVLREPRSWKELLRPDALDRISHKIEMQKYSKPIRSSQEIRMILDRAHERARAYLLKKHKADAGFQHIQDNDAVCKTCKINRVCGKKSQQPD